VGRKPTLTKPCDRCGKIMHPRPSMVQRGYGKYCSQRCNHPVMDNLKERFWQKVDKEFAPPCWIWTAAKDRHGYGCISRGGRGTGISAHRASYELHYGIIPEGLCVLHHCDNPSCVRPDHLFLGTQLDNVSDMMQKNRHHSSFFPKHEQHWNAKLSWEKVDSIRARISLGESKILLAREYGVSKTAIKLIAARKTWAR